MGWLLNWKEKQELSKVPNYMKNLKDEIPFDPDKQEPVMKCSICTGEQVAGFRNKDNGHITEIMVIRSEKELEYLKKIYGIEQFTKVY